MKQIEDIFSKSPTKNSNPCPNPKIPIIVDTREKQSLISANLIEQKANIKFEKLEIGDYLIKNTIVERKTFPDLIGSMKNKRLQEQLINIKKYPKQFIIIEGFNYNYDQFNIHENAVRGMLLSIATDFQVPIIFTKDCKDTSKFLILTAKKQEKPKQEYSIRESKNHKTPEEQKQFILEGFPGIGPIISKKLIKKFPNLKEIFNSKESRLKEIEKFDDNKIKKFLEILNS